MKADQSVGSLHIHKVGANLREGVKRRHANGELEEASGGSKCELRAATRASTRASESDMRARQGRDARSAARTTGEQDERESATRGSTEEPRDDTTERMDGEDDESTTVGEEQRPRRVNTGRPMATRATQRTTQVGTMGEVEGRDREQEEPANPRRSKRKSRVMSLGPGRRREEEGDDSVVVEEPTSKRRKTSAPVRQPPWTAAEIKKLQEVVAEGDKIGREKQDSYDEYNRRIVKEQPSWPPRSHNACRSTLKRLREGGDKTFKWSEEEVALAQDMHRQKKSAREICEALNEKYGKTRRARTTRAVKEKLLMLPPSSETSSPHADAPHVPAQDAAQQERPGSRVITSSRTTWTPEEDDIVRGFLKVVPVSVRDIKAALDKHRHGQEQLIDQRSLQAVRTRVQVLKSGKKINYQRRVMWGEAQDQLVKEVVKKQYTQARAIQYLVRRTGAARTFVRHRLARVRREMKTATESGDQGPHVDSHDREGSDDEDPREAEDLRPRRPDAWQDSDYFPSETSGEEGNSDEETPKPAGLHEAEKWSLTTPSLNESEKRWVNVDAESEEETNTRTEEAGRGYGAVNLISQSRLVGVPVVAESGGDEANKQLGLQPRNESAAASAGDPGDDEPSSDDERGHDESKGSPSEDETPRTPVPEQVPDPKPAGLTERELPPSAPLNGSPPDPAAQKAHISPSNEVSVEVPAIEVPEIVITTSLVQAQVAATPSDELPRTQTSTYEGGAPLESDKKGAEADEAGVAADVEAEESTIQAEIDATQEIVRATSSTADDDDRASESPMSLSWLDEDVSSTCELEELPSTGESEDSGEDRTVEAVPLTPRRGDREGETSTADQQRMSKWRLRYWDANRAAYVPISARNRSKLWEVRLDGTTEFARLADDYHRRYTARARSGELFVFLEQGVASPRVKGQFRSWLFVATFLLRDSAVLQVWLREMWDTAYPNCRDPSCCLLYECEKPGYEHVGICRHWEYLNSRRVHLDRFQHTHDYLLAMALSVHRDAFCETEGEYEEPAMGWQFMKLKVVGFGMASELTKHWSRDAHEESVRQATPVFGVLSAVLVKVKEGEIQRGRADLQMWDHGRLYAERTDQDEIIYERLGWGFSVQVQRMWVILTTAKCVDIDHASHRLVWSPRGNNANYVRRMEAIDRQAEHPSNMVNSLAARRTEVDRRPLEKRREVIALPEVVRIRGETDKRQYDVILRALTQWGIVLARGPYGCGKTSLITKLVVAYLAAFPDERILIVSEANAAIDEDLARLILRENVQPPKVVRIGLPRDVMGHPLQPAQEVRDAYVRCKCDDLRAHLERMGAGRGAREEKAKALESRMIREAQVVVSTLSMIGKAAYANQDFRLLIVDEGAQTLEASLLQALGKAVKTMVIVGDPFQLLPYTRVDEREREYFESEDHRHKLMWSPIHSIPHAHSQALGRWEFPGTTMDAEFRSHEKITQFLAPFYDYPLRDRALQSADYLSGMLLPVCLESVDWLSDQVRATQLKNVTISKERVIWLSPTRSVGWAQDRAKRHPEAPASAEPEARNVANYVEAAMVLDLLLRIRARLSFSSQLRGRTFVKTVLVITPYRSQVALINRLLVPFKVGLEAHLQFEVRTTDSSQGREAEVVIVSFVRNLSLGFLRDYPARSLVSLSRGKDYLFVVGSHIVLREDPTWKRVIENAQAHAVLTHEFEWTPQQATDRVYQAREQLTASHFPAATPPQSLRPYLVEYGLLMGAAQASEDERHSGSGSATETKESA